MKRRRSFSGKRTDLSDDEKIDNIHSVFGLTSKTQDPGKHVVMLGENLRSIAQKHYNDQEYWFLLALKNGFPTDVDQYGNPLAQLRRGQVLRLPDYFELESFYRAADAPVVVALQLDEQGLIVPLSRVCGSCQRETLAMAIDCVCCGVDMDQYVDESDDANEDSDDNENADEPEEEAENEAEDGEHIEEFEPSRQTNYATVSPEEDNESTIITAPPYQPSTPFRPPTPAIKAKVSNVVQAPVAFASANTQEQDETVVTTASKAALDQNETLAANHQATRQEQTTIHPNRADDSQERTVFYQPPTESPGSAPIQNQSSQNQFPPNPFAQNSLKSNAPAEKPFPSSTAASSTANSATSFWTPNEKPELLDSTVQVVEIAISGDYQGLMVVLQLLVQGAWLPIYEYHVFADDVVIVQYQNRAGKRRTKKSLPARLSRKMAWNHYRGNWQNICQDFLAN